MAEPRDYSMNIGVKMAPSGSGTEDIIASIQKLRAEYKDTLTVTEELVKQSKSFPEQLSAGLKTLETDLGKFQLDLGSIRNTISGLSAPIQMVTSQLTGMFSEEAKDYATVARKWEDSSYAYIQATDRVEEAQFRMGRNFATIMTPVLDQTARGMETMADFMDANPELVAAIAMVLTGGVAVMGIVTFFVTVVSTLEKFVLAVKTAIIALEGMKLLPAAGGAADALAGRLAFATGGEVIGGAGAGAAGATAGVVGGAIALGAVETWIMGRLQGALGEAIQNTFDLPSYKEQMTWVRDGLEKIVGKEGVLHDASTWLVNAFSDFGSFMTGKDWRPDDIKTAIDGLKEMTKEELRGLDLYKSFVEQKKSTDEAFQYSQQQMEIAYQRSRSTQLENFERQKKQIEENMQYQRKMAVENFEYSRALAETAYNEQRLKAIQNFAKQQYEAAGSHAESEAKSREQFRDQQIKAEEQYQKQILKMAEDHNTRISDLANSRDAMGIVRENERYSKTLKDADKSHDESTSTAEKEFNKRMKQMDEDFAKQQRKAQANFATQQAEQDANFHKQELRQKEQFERTQKIQEEQQKRQADLAQKNFDKQMETSERQFQLQQDNAQLQHERSELLTQRAFDKQLKQLDIWGDDTVRLQRAVLDQMREDYTSYLKSMPGYKGSTPIKKGSGGYAPHGLYELGEEGDDEFILNGSTTKKLEALFGNKLSQEGLLNLGGQGSSMTLAQNFTFVGSLSESEKMWYQNTARNQAYEAFRDVMEGRIGGLALA